MPAPTNNDHPPSASNEPQQPLALPPPPPPRDLPTEDEVEQQCNHPFPFHHFKVAPCEYTRFALYGAMFWIIGFVYSFMRIIKDTYVVVRQDPICILYLKVFYILPLSFVVVILINYMLSARSISRIFGIFTLFFAALFFVFGGVILFEEHVFFDPRHIRDHIETFLLDARGLGFLKHFLLTINEPLATLVYITAEMWGSLMLSYLFLSFMNEVCTRRQHARFVPPLFIITNVSLLVSAFVTTLFLKARKRLDYEQNTLLMAGIFAIEGVLCLVILMCKYFLEQRTLVRPAFVPDTVARTGAQHRGSTSFSEGLEIMMQSRFLLAMSGMVFFYSLTFNILESVHKNSIKRGAKLANAEKGSYAGHFNNIDQYLTATSVIALNLSSFSTLADRRGWRTVALISPIVAIGAVLGVMGPAIYNSGATESSISLLNKPLAGRTSALLLENYIGVFCLAAIKVFKFAAFDVAKEKITMRIEDCHRAKFKSVYDGICNKFGKSGGAVYSIVINSLIADIDLWGMSPVTALFMIPSLILWIRSVFYLGGSFEATQRTDGFVDIDLIGEEKQGEADANAEAAEGEKPAPPGLPLPEEARPGVAAPANE